MRAVEEGFIMKCHLLFGFALLSLSLAACSSGAPDDNAQSSEDQIVGGTADKAKDPAVVAIDIGGEALCSGSLIGPRLVLTARHCVSDTSEGVDCPASAPQIQGERPADSFTILVGDDFNTARPVAIGQRVIVPDSDVLCDHDIALIELDRAVTGIAPLSLGSLTGVKTVRGVGYGKRGDNAAAGKKMTRSNVPVLQESASEFMVGVLSCNGDSGGPALDSKGRVVGVVSRGGPNCDGPNSENIYTRVDAFHALIDQALGNAGGATSAGSGPSSGEGGAGGASTGSDTGNAGGAASTGAECGSGKRCANGTHCNQSTLRCEPVS
jgi:V8-like Glu-specific endopeptidase